MALDATDSQLRDTCYRVRVLARYRLYALAAIAAWCIFYRLAVALPLYLHLWLIGFALALQTVLFAWWACRQHSPLAVERVLMVGYLADLLLVGALCLSVHTIQPLAPLYFACVVVYGSLLLAPIRSLLMALVASCLYCGVLRWIASHAILATSEASLYDVWVLRFAVAGTAFNLTASATLSFFAELLRRKHGQVARANRRLRATASQLRQHKEDLERTIAERTQDLQEAYRRLKVANDELRRADQLKTQLLANVSHELRTPLTSIRSFSEILRAYPEQDAASRQEFLDIIVSECDRLSRLITDLLDLSRIESGGARWDFQPLDLREVVAEAIGRFQALAEGKGLVLLLEQPDDPIPLLADRDRLAQVLTNLLGNSLKFTSQGGVSVLLSVTQGSALLRVIDTGPGVPEGELGRLFDKFYQVSTGLADKPVGSGLGLAICREIVCHHGGRIWAEHNQPTGLAVCCELPLATKQGALLPMSPEEAVALAPHGGEGGAA